MSTVNQQKSFCELYLDAECFMDEANKTIGKPGISMEVFENRRKVTSRLTNKGEDVVKTILGIFEKHLGREVVAKWDRYCGCSMCPCSPGFRLKTNLGTHRQMKEDDRIQIYISDFKIERMDTPNFWKQNTATEKQLRNAIQEIEVKFGLN